jgi:hypothetical protein
MIKVTIQGNTSPDNREFAIIAGGKCLFRGELSPELKASDIWAEIGRLLENYTAPGIDGVFCAVATQTPPLAGNTPHNQLLTEGLLIMVQVKMTTQQLINTHCDSLSQISIARTISQIAVITGRERLGLDLGAYQQGNNSELWLINNFVNHQSKRQMIVTALMQRWQPRTDKL